MDEALAAAPRFHAPALFLYGGHDDLVPARATAATWRALPPGPVRAFYPNGYHLLLRDKDRAAPIGDILAWIRDPDAALPSGAEQAADAWLAAGGALTRCLRSARTAAGQRQQMRPVDASGRGRLSNPAVRTSATCQWPSLTTHRNDWLDPWCLVGLNEITGEPKMSW